MAEFKIKDINYRSGKMDLFRQFDVLRRIGPFVPSLTLLYSAKEKGVSVTDAVSVLGQSMLTTLSKMNDEDSRFILISCLSVVKRQQSHDMPYVDLLASNNRLMFDDTDLFTLGSICWFVLEETYGPFFVDLRSLAPTMEMTE